MSFSLGGPVQRFKVVGTDDAGRGRSLGSLGTATDLFVATEKKKGNPLMVYSGLMRNRSGLGSPGLLRGSVLVQLRAVSVSTGVRGPGTTPRIQPEAVRGLQPG